MKTQEITQEKTYPSEKDNPEEMPEEPKTTLCDFCGELIFQEDAHALGGEELCESCYEAATLCDHCGAACLLDNTISINDQFLCQTCTDSHTTTCQHCNDPIFIQQNAGSDSYPLCNNCFSDHYCNCDDCGAVIHYDDCHYTHADSDVPFCSGCFAHQRRDGIQCYEYRPDPIFYGEGKRYLGVELEIDEGGESNRSAKELLKIGNEREEHIYIKRDGSLDDGMEIVTHPMTLEYHKNCLPWESLVKNCRENGYFSHQSDTCGLHVHVNRKSFGKTVYEQDLSIARILFFVENHWNELLKFSRRTQRQLEKWAARYGRKDSPQEVLDAAKGGGYRRYTCVNLVNHHTIEFRIFRGTLKLNTILATLELVDVLCDLAMWKTDQYMQELSWTQFVSDLKEEKYPELIQYLKERRLYVNEPVNMEVES